MPPTQLAPALMLEETALAQVKVTGRPAATEMETVAGDELPVPLLTRKVKLSVPVKLAAGV